MNETGEVHMPVPIRWLDAAAFLRENPTTCIVCYEKNEKHEHFFAAHPACYRVSLPHERQYIDRIRASEGGDLRQRMQLNVASGRARDMRDRQNRIPCTHRTRVTRRGRSQTPLASSEAATGRRSAPTVAVPSRRM